MALDHLRVCVKNSEESAVTTGQLKLHCPNPQLPGSKASSELGLAVKLDSYDHDPL